VRNEVLKVSRNTHTEIKERQDMILSL